MKSLSAIQSIKQGILICDKQGKIVYFNKAYAEYIGVELKDVVGHKITLHRKKALVPTVLKTGVPIEGILREEGDQEYYASVYPIIENDQIEGSISIVTSIDQFWNLKQNEGKTLAQRVKEFEAREIENLLKQYGSDLNGKKKVAKELGISLATLYNKLNMK